MLLYCQTVSYIIVRTIVWTSSKLSSAIGHHLVREEWRTIFSRKIRSQLSLNGSNSNVCVPLSSSIRCWVLNGYWTHSKDIFSYKTSCKSSPTSYIHLTNLIHRKLSAFQSPSSHRIPNRLQTLGPSFSVPLCPFPVSKVVWVAKRRWRIQNQSHTACIIRGVFRWP